MTTTNLNGNCRCGVPHWRIAVRDVRFGVEWCIVEHLSHTIMPDDHWCYDHDWGWSWAVSERRALRRGWRQVRRQLKREAVYADQRRAIKESQ